jgi:xylulokinase
MGAFRPGSLLNTLGTWDNVITAIAEPSRTEAARAAGVCVQAHVAPEVWSVWGGTVAGESLEWFRREIGEHSMDELDAAAPGAGGVLYLPHISGTSCPIGDPRSAGSFVGITLATKRADLCRAVVEGLNYQFRDILNSLQEGLNCRFNRITAVGGGIRNRYWVRNRADVAGLPVETSDIEEATLLGAAMLAGVGAGVYSDLVEAVRCVSAGGTVHNPRPERTKAYTERFSVYRKLYPALRPLHHALFQLEKP